MSQNLVSTIINMVTPAIVERVAAAVGISPELARKGLTAALPTILGMVASRAATPNGANQLFSAISKIDPNTDMTRMLSGASAQTASTAGSDMMNALIGGNETSGLVEVISRYAGLSGTAGSGLVGLGTQFVMNQLARTRATGSLDANGLASLLSSQQGAIQAALPAGLSSLLASSGAFGQTFSRAAGAAQSTAQQMPNLQKPAIATGAPRNGVGTNLLMWIIPVALIAGAAWYYMSANQTPAPAPEAQPATTSEQPAQQPAASAEQPAQQPAASAEQPAQQPAASAEQPAQQPAASAEQPAADTAAPVAMPAMPDMGKPLVDAFGSATSALGLVTDATTAKAALPAIESLQKLLDGSATAAAALTAEQKAALNIGLQPAIAAFKAAAEKVMAVPGVSDVLKPVVDTLLTKAGSIAN